MKFKTSNHIVLVISFLTHSLAVNGFIPLGYHHHRNFLYASTVMDAVEEVGEKVTTNTDLITFPPPLGKMDRIKRAVTFWASTAPIVSNYYANMAKQKVLDMHGLSIPVEESEALWNRVHQEGAEKLAQIISDMKGFYTKAAQIVATRGDLFPKQYIQALNQFADNLDPMPAEMAKQIVAQELLQDGETFQDVFSEFDNEPLGSASVAQVHRAVLSENYDFREVAVKIQRPSIESKLMGDIANLKMIAKVFRELDASPVDYFTVFSELEIQLQDEFDFLQEASAMNDIYNTLNKPLSSLPVVIPRTVPGLITSRVIVMDYIKGTPFSRLQNEKEIKAGSIQSKLFGNKFLSSLTEVFGRTILESGLFHADPHPGNLLITEKGDIALIDYGQVKQLTPVYQETIAKIILAIEDRKHDDALDETESNQLLQKLIQELGVELKQNAKPEAGAAIAMWLFDGSASQLPGGYDSGELSPNAPVKEIKEFPQDLVLVARSAMLIKAFSNRFQIRWSLSEHWAPVAYKLLCGEEKPAFKRRRGGQRLWTIAKRIKQRGVTLAKASLRVLF